MNKFKARIQSKSTFIQAVLIALIGAAIIIPEWVLTRLDSPFFNYIWLWIIGLPTCGFLTDHLLR